MKYFVPELRLGVLSPPQNEAMDKFGGLPWGMPAGQWPRCTTCKHSMALVAQLFHHDQRLNLGAPGRCLFVFMCSTPISGCSETFDPKSGNNSSFVLEPGELAAGLTRPPDSDASWPIWSAQCSGLAGLRHLDGKAWINVEAQVLGWREQDDGVDPAGAPAFMDFNGYWDLPRDQRQRIYSRTKLGGAPYWLQGPPAEDGGSFCAQFSDAFVFPPPLPHADEIGCRVSTGGRKNHRSSDPKVLRHDGPNEACEISGPAPHSPEGSWCCGAANFGMGMAYLFLRSNGAAPPSCEFMWQC